MGLFGFLGKVASLPVKIVEAPVRIVESALGDDSHLVSGEMKGARKAIKKVMDEVDDELAE